MCSLARPIRPVNTARATSDALATGAGDQPCCPMCSCPIQTHFDHRERVEESVCRQCGWKLQHAECASGQWLPEDPAEPEPEANHIDKAAQENAAKELLIHWANGPLLKIICAWCGKVLREGVLPISHGICQDCASRPDPFAGDEMVDLADIADIDPPPF